MTSRQPIIDMIELIANLIASASHLQELIDNEEDIEKKDILKQQLYEIVDIRRTVMKEIECKDDKLWCSLKHAIAQRGYAIEILYTVRTPLREEIVDSLTKYMYSIVSEYMGVEIVDCSRCLMDKILSHNTKDEGTTKL